MIRTVFPASLPEAARRELADWFDACRRVPGALPDGTEIVHSRIVRTVGAAELTGVGRVFLKVMAFPRPKDRVRYLLRRLPAEHEARALDSLARRAPDLPCPEPLGILAVRRAVVPALSVLVTRGLPIDPTGAVPTPAARAAAAARLADAGIEHPDLHTGNFVRLADGRTGVLDLQSARVRSGPLPPAARRAMAAKLVQDRADDETLRGLAAAGLVADGDLDSLRADAERLRRQALLGRVRRCLQESSEFTARRAGLGKTLWRRRADPARWTPIRDDRAHELWLGDRFSEVVDGAPPVLAGMSRRWPWHSAPTWVYLEAADARAVLAAHRERLLDGYRRLIELRDGGDVPR